MSTFAKVFLRGNVGQDPKNLTKEGGDEMAKISLAVNDVRNGEKTTQWVDCLCFKPIAGTVLDYVRKGMNVEIHGRLMQDSFTKDDNTVVKRTYVIASEMFLPPKPAGSGNGGTTAEEDEYGAPPPPRASGRPAPAAQAGNGRPVPNGRPAPAANGRAAVPASRPAARSTAVADENFDDDLPF